MPSFVRGVTSTLRDESMACGMLDRHRPPPTLSPTNRGPQRAEGAAQVRCTLPPQDFEQSCLFHRSVPPTAGGRREGRQLSTSLRCVPH